MTEEKTNKISIYLLKEGKTPKDILKKENKELELNDDVFYYDNSHSYKPSWVTNFFNSKLENIELFNQSSKGVYFVKVKINSKERFFAIPFGYGHSMIKKFYCVDDFGLKIVLNAVDGNSIRKIEKRTLSSDPKNTIEQLSKTGGISDFGIDIEQDLIEEITGKPKKDSYFGENLVVGKVAFTVSAKVNILNIKDFLKRCFEFYKKDDYKENFAFIDQVKEIKNTEEWDVKLIEKLKDDGAIDVKVWMAIPEIIDWADVAGFSFVNKKEKLIDDITLENFKNSLSENQIDNLDLKFLERKKVSCFKNSTDDEYDSWSYFQCFYCEITKDNRKIILTNGKWYEITKDFVEEVEKNYSEVINCSSKTTLIDCEKEDHEDVYNKKLAKSIDGIVMDRINISYGGGHSSVEFCDVYDVKNKVFIHVKNYYGSSALSHLFAQGRVSGQLFISDPKFRKKVKEKKDSLPFNPEKDQNSKEYKIIFGIISESENNLNLPFFSKVNFKNERNILNTFGFKDVYLIKIKRK